MYKRFLKTRKLSFNWDVAPMPRGPVTQATTFIWGGNCIFRGTKHPKEGWEFLKFISGKEGAQVTVEAGNAMPPLHARPARRSSPIAAMKACRRTTARSSMPWAYGRVAPFPPAVPGVQHAPMTPLHESFIGLGHAGGGVPGVRAAR
jgi:ABC-type glycerol-3-phosphate transport system substrate-binding protein